VNGPPDLKPLLDLLASYEWVMWFLLVAGIISLLQTTVFYRPMMRCGLLLLRKARRSLQSLPDNQVAQWNKRTLRWGRKNYRSRKLRIVSLLWSLGMILSAGAGLLLIHFRDSII
jgi:hypothetical protein